jgi:hypothetical protein
MRRREFITLFGATALGWPLTTRAQQSAMPVIGHLGIASAQGYATQVVAFRQGLAETGYFDGRNVAIEYRWADYQSPSAINSLRWRPGTLCPRYTTPRVHGCWWTHELRTEPS